MCSSAATVALPFISRFMDITTFFPRFFFFFFFFFSFRYSGYKLGFWIFSRIRFFEFFFFGGVIAGYYIAPLAPTKKVVLCEAVIFFCGGNEAKNFLGIL